MSIVIHTARSLAVVLFVAALLFCGFFTSPGNVALFDPEYRKLSEIYVPERASLIDRRLDLESDLQDHQQDLVDVGHKIEGARLRLKENKDPELQAELESLLNLKSTVDGQLLEIDKSIKRLETDIDELTRLIERTQGQAENVHLVLRAISLGALGAVVYTLVQYMSRRRWADLFADANLERAAATALVGAIFAVVVFAVFHTKEVTIFSAPDTSPDARPDFWRVTILCLGVGALAAHACHRAFLRIDRMFGALPANEARPATAMAENGRPEEEPEYDDTRRDGRTVSRY